MSMSIPRAVATRAAPLVRPRVAAVAPLTCRRFASSNKDDLGGPGGQAPPPKDPNPPKDTSSWIAIGGAGLLLGSIFFYITSNPGKAAQRKQQVDDAKGAAKDAIKDGRLPSADDLKKGVQDSQGLEEFSGRGQKGAGEKGLSAHRQD